MVFHKVSLELWNVQLLLFVLGPQAAQSGIIQRKLSVILYL